ncbi:Hsp20/alpha crystallin family protein [Cellulophaga sp. E16_2]|uniref:Heat shock protein Hsp20 n=1 Tax=Cellulophaga algicola (strain DSM 14237 / IC166 / ACAM 630) TaxID=688270 RepID=E6X9D4_CELAD|nr:MULTISPECIES: Hsp20/alpha crystallin family protein [Cellulophaga]ADV47673.1 heat shock protein Hsp20 [Cellulophaga algicola DSM 14237]MBO0590037.1 Hsp20/alpha crystallin family protein [Cellulophaga sp. E16_2]
MSTTHKNVVSIPALMNELFKPDWFGGAEVLNSKVPAVNIREGDTSFVLELVAPGRKKEDFKIEIDNDLLSVSSEVKKESSETLDSKEVEKVKYTRKEYSFTSFKRAFTLPDTVNVEDIKASYENGILSFNLPKKEEALPKPKRLIELA